MKLKAGLKSSTSNDICNTKFQHNLCCENIHWGQSSTQKLCIIGWYSTFFLPGFVGAIVVRPAWRWLEEIPEETYLITPVNSRNEYFTKFPFNNMAFWRPPPKRSQHDYCVEKNPSNNNTNITNITNITNTNLPIISNSKQFPLLGIGWQVHSISNRTFGAFLW